MHFFFFFKDEFKPTFPGTAKGRERLAMLVHYVQKLTVN